MIYISAGHNTRGKKTDPGAIGNGFREADLTIELRDLIITGLEKLAAKFVSDQDTETLADYIKRIKPGSGSVVCEVHFNAGVPAATGIEVIFAEHAKSSEIALATSMSLQLSEIIEIKNRGAKDETTSHRGRLGILHTGAGISILPEICFISNKSDLDAYFSKKAEVAKAIAKMLVAADNIYS